MIKLVLLIFFLLISFNTNAQNLKESDIPAAVKTKFNSLFPGVNNVHWEMEGGRYWAEFDQNNLETSVSFESNGTLVQTKSEISVSQLPKQVNDYVNKNLSGRKINEAEKITGANGTVSYEAEIGNSNYLFDSEGNFVKKSSDSDSDNDRDDDKNNDSDRNNNRDNDRNNDNEDNDR